MHATLNEWIAREAISFSIDSPDSAVDQIVGLLGDSVDLLALGEPLHGGEDILILRNRLFHRLVESHGYTAIAVESSFPRAHAVNDYVAGQGATYDAVRETGFSHGFGQLEANRELVEWMRQYNADPAHPTKIQFHGFDSPTEMMGTSSPRQLLMFALDYLATMDLASATPRRDRIEAQLGRDAEWENPDAMMDPSKSIGLSPAAVALRIETEELITELSLRRPEFIRRSDPARYLEAAQHASLARQLLTYHAGLAGTSPSRIADLLGLRDVMMAENLNYMVTREQIAGRGKVFAFAHNSHLHRGQAKWQLGPHALAWWPAGAHLHATLGPRYAVIGTGIGVSEANGLAQPEPNTLEAMLTADNAQARFIPTYRGEDFPASAIAALPTRSGSKRNSTYFALTPQSLADFDALAVLNSTTYTRGGRPLPQKTP